ncbi:hypothetical protein KAR91_02815 [Candidatus Pacearchaeota archaeon]|nr:hypothetical protein [Candidatus Pacearchaeota archaeon]
MKPEKVDHPQTQFEREVVEPTKRTMEDAMAQAFSKADAKRSIKEALPEDRLFLGPLVIYGETDSGLRHISAMVTTIDESKRENVNIEATYTG